MKPLKFEKSEIDFLHNDLTFTCKWQACLTALITALTTEEIQRPSQVSEILSFEHDFLALGIRDNS